MIDVRGVFQYLAEKAIAAGAQIRLSTAAIAPVLKAETVAGVRTRTETLECSILIDATGYRGMLLKQAGIDSGFRRFGVGAEYDLYAPNCDQEEAVLVVGKQAAPSGYGWVFPWGRHRVRIGVGIIHPDSKANSEAYLDRFVSSISRLGVDLRGAQPIEHHAGFIPSERFADRFVGNGIMGVGDSAGHASALLGEGIRWGIMAGRMAGDAAADAIESGNTSRAALEPFEKKWRKRFANDHRLAHRVNQRIARWDDRKWDERTEILKLLTPEQFVEALKTHLTGGWLWRFLRANPRALVKTWRPVKSIDQVTE